MPLQRGKLLFIGGSRRLQNSTLRLPLTAMLELCVRKPPLNALVACATPPVQRNTPSEYLRWTANSHRDALLRGTYAIDIGEAE
jgi:type II secretory pathway component PulL